jgi:hypothetical protein
VVFSSTLSRFKPTRKRRFTTQSASLVKQHQKLSPNLMLYGSEVFSHVRTAPVWSDLYNPARRKRSPDGTMLKMTEVQVRRKRSVHQEVPSKAGITVRDRIETEMAHMQRGFLSVLVQAGLIYQVRRRLLPFGRVWRWATMVLEQRACKRK